MDAKAGYRGYTHKPETNRQPKPPHAIFTQPLSGNTVIAGGGPAGLTAAYELTRKGFTCTVLESEKELVGGISRTDSYKGYRFDIGGHRFFSKSDEVNQLWQEILGDHFLKRPRLSRIYYNRKFFDYPLKPVDAFLKLGPIRSAHILLSYFKARLLPLKNEKSFEDWVVNRFGRKLFETFFKAYTEKVWGMPTSEISADWAAQRIKGLSLVNAVTSVLFKSFRKSGKGGIIKTLIDEFHYPKFGPGQMWEAARDHIRQGGNQVAMDSRVVRIEHDGSRVSAFISRDVNGNETRHTGRNFISTLPLKNLIQAMCPAAPAEVQEAAMALKYRDFLTVVLIADQADTFPDTWIYVHDPEVKLGRVQNFKNWSPHMVPDLTKSSLGLEYFCFKGDGLWSMTDEQLIALGTKEIAQIGLVDSSRIVDGCVVRMPKAYPVYDDEYQQNVGIIRRWLSNLENLQVAGRNGMHKYNNQDHSMMTALLAARNIMGAGPFDPWYVNTDAEYHEEKMDDPAENKAVGRIVPQKLVAGT